MDEKKGMLKNFGGHSFQEKTGGMKE